ncbi:hypothetical protein DVH24_004940 [Malus domestica]|uniref:Uncharacterized protein n=1 Tax=Malus domestica TaxID=3750 RepID=A0A498IC27_MALDO|nr:hypothetical protein DVH24_004940 [Malus domestica]
MMWRHLALKTFMMWLLQLDESCLQECWLLYLLELLGLGAIHLYFSRYVHGQSSDKSALAKPRISKSNMLDVGKISIRVWYMLADRKVAICPYLQRRLLLHYHIRGIKDKPSFNLRMVNGVYVKEVVMRITTIITLRRKGNEIKVFNLPGIQVSKNLNDEEKAPHFPISLGDRMPCIVTHKVGSAD